MKKMWIVVTILLVMGGAVFLAKNMIAQMAVSGGVKAITGLRLDIGSMDVGIMKTLIGIKDLKLFNPRGFQDQVMVDMPEIYVDYDLGAFLKRKVHLEELRLNLKEFTVVKNEKGELNLDALRTVKEAKKEKTSPEKKGEGKIPPIQIDTLDLQVGKVVYKDYSKGTPPRVNEFTVNLHERHENITDPYALGNLIVTRALIHTTVARLANFDVAALEGQLTDVVKKYSGTLKNVAGSGKDVVGSARKTAKETVGALKKIFSGGQ